MLFSLFNKIYEFIVVSAPGFSYCLFGFSALYLKSVFAQRSCPVYLNRSGSGFRADKKNHLPTMQMISVLENLS